MKTSKRFTIVPIAAFIFAALFLAGLSLAGCKDPSDDSIDNQTPVAGDYTVGNLSQTAGKITAVTISPKPGKSSGAITVYYEGKGGTKYARSKTLPTAAGTYTVTFDVAEASGWNAASGLSAGTLTINAAISGNQTPSAADYDIGNLTQTAGNVSAVTITPKPGKSTGAVTIYYNGYLSLPSAPGTYTVTFDVAAVTNWNAVRGLSAGTLTINAVISGNQTPSVADFDIGNLTQTAGNVSAVTIAPKDGKSTGTVTIYYSGSPALPTAAGTYVVTFDVAAANGFYAVSGLYAGLLTINAATPVTNDYNISGTGTFTYDGGQKTVTVTPKSGTSAGAVTVLYNGSATAPANAGTYTVTFNVAEANGWYTASGLSAGTLTISNATPAIADYDFGNLTQIEGNVSAVTIEPKQGKSSGAITIYYNGSTELPTAVGNYAVTFDVAEASNWNAAEGLNAENLIIGNPANQTPVASDYEISGTGTFTYAFLSRRVTVTAKSGKSTGAVTVKYNGSTTAPFVAGTYTVTFDVEAVSGWNAASGLSAGTLTIDKATPTASDFNISGTGTFIYDGNVKTVTVTGRPGFDMGTRTVKYNNSITAPSAAGTYTVTFDVGEDWLLYSVNAASGLSAGTLIIINATPAADDYDIGNLTQIPGNVSAVTVTPKPGKSSGARTVYYNGSTALPATEGSYAVTFDVAAATNWNAATGLSAGTLTINVRNPVTSDFTISNSNLTQTVGNVSAVSIVPKTGKSNGAITIRYNGSTTLPTAVGTYTVTFDVAADTDWNAVTGLGAGTLKIVELVVMVWVPGGSFQMGKELGTAGSGDVMPVHTVRLSGFYMGKYPVTQAQYQAVIGTNPSNFSSSPVSGEVQGNRPVEKVPWYDAVEFCNKLSEKEGLQTVYTISGRTPSTGYPITNATVTADWSKNGYRLPTEAQWEYAAKGGSTPGNYTYSGSNTVGDVAWYSGNSNSRTHEVGKKQANGLGIYDMSGNVFEWCWDWRGDYPSVAQTDPVGPSSGTDRVRRGGSWFKSAYITSLVHHDFDGPNNGDSDVGFRLVRP